MNIKPDAMNGALYDPVASYIAPADHTRGTTSTAYPSCGCHRQARGTQQQQYDNAHWRQY
jgi:hypothetical protein